MAESTFYGAGGIIYRAPLDTSFPAFSSGLAGYGTALETAGFEAVADISEDGLTVTPSADTVETKNWYGKTKRILHKGHSEVFTFNLIDHNEEAALNAAYGENNVDKTAATSSHGNLYEIEYNAAADDYAWCVVMYDGAVGTVFQIAKGNNVAGAEVYSDGDIVKIPCTLTALDNGTDPTVVKLIDDGRKVVTP